MDQRGAVCAKLMLDPVEPHHGPALPFRDWLPSLTAVDALTCRIDRPGATLRLLPVVLERTTTPVLRFVDLAVGMQLCQRVAADRPKRDDLVAGFEPEGIVHLD